MATSEKSAIPKEDAPRYDEEAVLYKLIKNTLRYWWLFALIALCAAVVGYIYASLKKPVYQSYVSFALEGGSASSSSAALGLASQLGINFTGATDVFSGENILKIMSSRKLIEETLLTADTFAGKPQTLIEYFRQNLSPKDHFENVHFPIAQPRDEFSYLQDSILYVTYLQFKHGYITTQKPDIKYNIYELMVRSPEERFSKIFTDVLINKANLFYKDISSKKSRETLEILEKQVPAMKKKLDASISAKAGIEDANLNTTFARADVGQIIQMNDSKVYGAAYGELFKNLEIARFQYLKSIPLFQVIDQAQYPLQRIKPGKLSSAVIFAFAAVILTGFVFLLFSFLKYFK